MPNWTTNVIICHDSDLSSLLMTDGSFSFEKWMPMPNELLQTEGSWRHKIVAYAQNELPVHDAMEIFADSFSRPDFERLLEEPNDETGRIACPSQMSPFTTHHIGGHDYIVTTPGELAELGEQYISNMRRYDAATWYDWSVSAWGTKWDAAEFEIVHLGDGFSMLSFDTAWNPPSDELAEMILASCKRHCIYETCNEGDDVVWDVASGESIEPEESVCFERRIYDEQNKPVSQEGVVKRKEADPEAEFYSFVSAKLPDLASVKAAIG